MLNKGPYQAFSASAMRFFTSLSTEDGDDLEAGIRQLFYSPWAITHSFPTPWIVLTRYSVLRTRVMAPRRIA